MQNTPIVTISDLSCSYSRLEKDKVLFIKKLSLERGKIIFLLGASGTGKSTLLETLGLMNNTISSGTVKLVSGINGDYSYSELWNNNNEHEINRIRKNYLSFIFQNTNLMENFTAYENICLSGMIKSGKLQSSAMNGAVNLMEQVSLPESEVGVKTLSVNLSGGQRQRVSFVRALNSEFQLLLCDEPTGNLDEVNARELMNIIRGNLSDEKTAVIVSHDVNLALKYADQIILITPNADRSFGEILESNIYERKYWESLNERELNDFRKNVVHSFLTSKEKSVIETGKDSGKLNKDKSYRQLFVQKEGRVLFGKSLVNIFILISIISLTLIAIGFANGALEYMNSKIKDPFVNWITIPLPSTKNSSQVVNEILDSLNSPLVKNSYQIQSATSYKETSLLFFPPGKTESEFMKGRLLSMEDPIADDLFGRQNYVRGDSNFINKEDLGIVVTLKLLQRLNYPEDAKFVYLDNSNHIPGTKVSFQVPIPIRAVVKNIPNRNNFLITSFFYSSYLAHEDCIFDYSFQKKRILFYTGRDKELAKSLQLEISKNLDKLVEFVPKEELTIDVDSYDYLPEKGFVVSVSFNTSPEDPAITESVYSKIRDLSTFSKNKKKIDRVFDFDIAPQQSGDIMYDYLSINFINLNKVDEFSKYITKSLNSSSVKEESNLIEVDAGIIKEKNNFNYMSKMTLLISTLLIVFSIVAISLFISNLLKTHLNKVKSNLGTYKAFGLSNRESVSIYLVIMLRFILVGIFCALVISFGIGKLLEIAFTSQFMIDDQIQYFKLFDFKTYLLITIIITVTVVVSYANIIKILNKTPGDLIYNR